MKRLLIVEDNPHIAAQIEKHILNIDNDLHVFITGYAKEALEIAALYPIDAFFLDIQLLDYSGLELAEKIRHIKGYKNTIIVFITGMVSREMEAFKQYHCYDYILKPFSDETIHNMLLEVIEGCLNEPIQHEALEIKIKQKNHNYLIKQSEIVYIEALNRKLHIMLKSHELVFSMVSLKELKESLSDAFLQCHRSFIVNRYSITFYDSVTNTLRLEGVEKDIPVGRKYVQTVKEIFKNV